MRTPTARFNKCIYASQNGVHYGSTRHPYDVGDSTRSAEAFRQLSAAKGLTMLQLTVSLDGPLTQASTTIREHLPCPVVASAPWYTEYFRPSD